MDKELKNDIVKEIHQIFLNSMETRYKEVLTFLGFLLPSLTAFIVLSYNFNLNHSLFLALEDNKIGKSVVIDTTQHEKANLDICTIPDTLHIDSSKINLEVIQPNNNNIEESKNERKDSSIIFTFFLGSLVIILILAWGAIYSLAVSYRYRYLQASVYLIEETTGANNYIPSSFKPKRIVTIKGRLFLDIAPSILQINVHFFALSIVGITLVFDYLTITNGLLWYGIIFSIISLIFTISIYYCGGWLYPKKMEKIILDLEEKLKVINTDKSKSHHTLITKL